MKITDVSIRMGTAQVPAKTGQRVEWTFIKETEMRTGKADPPTHGGNCPWRPEEGMREPGAALCGC